MSVATPRARVTLQPRRLWSVRAAVGLSRWLLYALALAGIAAAVRNAVAAPRAAAPARTAARPSDAAARWLALQFTRAYLTWSPDDRAARARALAPFLASATGRGAGLAPARGTSEQVRWVAIAGARDGGGGQLDYTVAAGLATGAVRYLAVAVRSGATGAELTQYPALVDPPPAVPAGALDGAGDAVLARPALVAVLERALRNYLDSSEQNLAADLAPAARVAAVPAGLSLRSVTRLAVAAPDAVLATLVVADAAGDAYTLSYRVTVARVAGRWEITAIEP